MGTLTSLYASPSQMLERYDSRILGQLLEDDGTIVSAANAKNHPRLIAALEDATGQIRSAATVGDKYTNEQLEQLSRDEDPFLVRMACGLALGFLYARRQSTDQLPDEVIRFEEWLATLRFGERIFPIAEVKEAGNTTHGYIADNTRGYLQLVGDKSRYFRSRESRTSRRPF